MRDPGEGRDGEQDIVTPGDRPVPSGPFHEKVPHAMARTTLTLGSPA